jgi:hypothetical protein
LTDEPKIITRKASNGYQRKYHGVVVGYRKNAHGSDIPVVRATAPCRRCGTEFTFTMTTQPERNCDGCKEIVLREKRARSKAQSAAHRLRKKSETTKPRRLIPYAGFDKREQE